MAAPAQPSLWLFQAIDGTWLHLPCLFEDLSCYESILSCFSDCEPFKDKNIIFDSFVCFVSVYLSSAFLPIQRVSVPSTKLTGFHLLCWLISSISWLKHLFLVGFCNAMLSWLSYVSSSISIPGSKSNIEVNSVAQGCALCPPFPFSNYTSSLAV